MDEVKNISIRGGERKNKLKSRRFRTHLPAAPRIPSQRSLERHCEVWSAAEARTTRYRNSSLAHAAPRAHPLAACDSRAHAAAACHFPPTPNLLQLHTQMRYHMRGRNVHGANVLGEVCLPISKKASDGGDVSSSRSN